MFISTFLILKLGFGIFQDGIFVFNETELPSFAPIIEPMSAKIAGNQIISPQDQNIAAAQMHVKIVTHKEVTKLNLRENNCLFYIFLIFCKLIIT